MTSSVFVPRLLTDPDQLAVVCRHLDTGSSAAMFDGAAVTDSAQLRAFATDLLWGADWLDRFGRKAA